MAVFTALVGKPVLVLRHVPLFFHYRAGPSLLTHWSGVGHLHSGDRRALGDLAQLGGMPGSGGHVARNHWTRGAGVWHAEWRNLR